MEVEEVVKKARDLEIEISKLIADYERDTSTYIDYINLERVFMDGKRGYVLVEIKVCLK